MIELRVNQKVALVDVAGYEQTLKFDKGYDYMVATVPTIADVESAAQTISGHAIRTPLLQSGALNAITDANVFVKPENLQLTGSFKFRGAYNAIAKLSEAERTKGVVACSSGNHAQGIGEAARRFGVAATIVMPADAPSIKIERTLASGAKVIHYNRETDDRDEISNRLVSETGAVLIHPYNNADVIAGQGTCGLEIAEDLEALGKTADRVFVCTGGGGLTAGVAIAIHSRFPNAKIHTVEPEDFDDYRLSLEAGEIRETPQRSGSICDAILAPSPGAIGFEINRNLVAEGLVISDRQALAAVHFAFEELKLVVEPGGAAALAALLKMGKQCAGEHIVVVISGGNVDPDVFMQAISE